MTHTPTNKNKNISTAQTNWDSSINFGNNSNVYNLVQALLSEADRLDEDITEVYHQHAIDTANGKSLNRFGKLINLQRQTNESDESYRARIKAEVAQKLVEVDYDSFVEFISAILNVSNEDITIDTNYTYAPATVTVRTDSSVYENAGLSNTEIVEILNNAVSAGHRVNPVESGTFLLTEDGDKNVAENGLTSDSIETGGTLAQDFE